MISDQKRWCVRENPDIQQTYIAKLWYSYYYAEQRIKDIKDTSMVEYRSKSLLQIFFSGS